MISRITRSRSPESATLGPRHLPNGGRWYLGASPSKKSVQRVKVKMAKVASAEVVEIRSLERV
jgi:hypothetical protein